MTWVDLLEFTADELEKLTDEDLHKILSPKYEVTRPELAQRLPAGVHRTASQIDPAIQLKLKQLAALGIDASHITKSKHFKKK